MGHLVRTIVACVVTTLLAPFASGELPRTRFDRLEPLGGAAGTTVAVRIAASKPDGVKTLLFDHPGLSAEFVEDGKFRIAIAKDVPEGWYDVRLVGRWGVSNPRLFAVSHELTDVADTEPNNDAEKAQPVVVNSAVNGTSDGNGEDTFRVSLRAGQRVVFDCLAQRLDSQMDATLILRSPEGRVLATNRDHFGSDPFLDHTATADGDVLVTVHDLSFRGGHPYRLVVTDRPHVENVFPRVLKVGTTTEVVAAGRNLGEAATRSELSLHGAELDALHWTVEPPEEITTQGAYRFVEHPTAHSVLPTAATCTLTGFQVQPRIGGRLANPTTVMLSTDDVTIEVEPNDDREKPRDLTLPAIVSGRFDRPRDADWYRFEVPENGQYTFEVYSERINGNADPYLVVLDPDGNRVGELDDHGHRVNAFDGHLRDPSGTITLQAGKAYRVLVQDSYRRGGPRYQYVLAVRRPRPDFYVATMHDSNPDPGGTTVWKGGATYVDLVVHQVEGFDGPVTITAENLPPGMHAARTVVSHTNRGAFVLWADADAPDWAGTITLVATGERDGETIRRTVRPHTRVSNQGNSSRATRNLAIAIVEKAPFAVTFERERLEVTAGNEANIDVMVDRLWSDVTDKVTLRLLANPNGVSIDVAEIGSGADSATVTIKVQGNVRPGEYTIVLDAQCQVPFSEDSAAKDKPRTLVTMPSRPLTLVVEPAASE